jgi:D-3-phosphoglycerate dehydrogenase
MKKVLVSDYVHPSLISGLKERGYDVHYDRHFLAQDLDSVLSELSGIVINTKIPMMRERIMKAEKLEFIARLGSGLDIIDLEAADERNIKVINTPEGNCDAVAEHAIGMLLSLSNKLLAADRQLRQRIWKREENRGFELGGKTIGIVGLGNTGRAMCRKLSCWGLEIIYSDPYISDIPADLSYLKAVKTEELAEMSDIISLHVQLTNETRHLVDEAFLKRCKNGAILINSSRGAVVDSHALVNALENKKLAGACLDVFENEKPLTFSNEENKLYDRLYAMENVVMSPHVAGWTHESLKRVAEVMLKKLDGRPL